MRTCDSVVRAPIAPQVTKSAVYCGVMVSRINEPIKLELANLSSTNKIHLKIRIQQVILKLQYQPIVDVRLEGLY